MISHKFFFRQAVFVTVLGAIGVIALSDLAFSQSGTSAAKPNGIEITPIIVAVINLVFPLVAAIATAVVNARIKNKQLADMLHNAIDNSLGILKKKATDAAQGAVIDTQPGSGGMDAAVQYVVDNAAEAVKHFDIPDARIADKIVAKLGLAEIATNLATTNSAGNSLTLAPMAPTIGD